MKNQSYSLLIGVLILTQIISCTSSQYTIQSSQTHLKVNPVTDPDLLSQMIFKSTDVTPVKETPGPVRGFIVLDQAISLVIEGTKRMISNERKKYISNTSRDIQHLKFYDRTSEKGPFDPQGMQFKGIDILNLVDLHGKTDTAYSFQFEVNIQNGNDILNNSQFTLRLKEASIKYSTARLAVTQWFNPFTWGQTERNERLNMDIEIIFRASYITSSGEMVDKQETGRFFLPIRNLPMNPQFPDYQQAHKNLRRIPVEGYSFLIPRSKGTIIQNDNQFEEIYGQGLYQIEVNIREAGSEKFITRLLYDNANGILNDLNKEIRNSF